MSRPADGLQCDVRSVEVLKKLADCEAARALLNQVKLHADALLKARGWHVKRLVEICCCGGVKGPHAKNDNVGGWCRADGSGVGAAVIAIRLRRPRSHDFYHFEHCVAVVIHEMTHIVHGNHSASFYQLMDELKGQHETFLAKGMVLDAAGFPLSGGAKMDAMRHNPADAREARGKALSAAETRAKQGAVMGTAGGARLGGATKGGAAWDKLEPREAALRAAERRAADAAQGLGDDELGAAAAGPIRWDGSWRAMCPVCGPVCADVETHATVDSDDDGDDYDDGATAGRQERTPALFIEAGRAGSAKACSQGDAEVDLTTLDDDDDVADAPALWECARCTLLNDDDVALACSACGAPRAANNAPGDAPDDAPRARDDAATRADAALAAALAAADARAEEEDARLAARLAASIPPDSPPDTSGDADIAAALMAADVDDGTTFVVEAPRPREAPKPPGPGDFDPCQASLNGVTVKRRPPG
ncbi:WLM domain-containing protein [Pelagophyceae sp. CCMP2097]|nr:WLM domain-containing protein [Pelagophyceae sp. CCMP2097]